VISRFPSSRNFGRKKLISENRDMILPRLGEGGENEDAQNLK
jgi:hypothetical protein